MFLHLALVVATVHALPAPETAQPVSSPEPKQLLYLPERQQYPQEFQYDLSLLAPQYQIPYNFAGDKQPFPRVQPQIVLYHGGAAPGQPFLLQPGTPPGNFLVPQPQPGPNVILRNTPQRPVFVAGYPKPAHIPPIEKDAEEVPTNPSKIPPLSPKDSSKPEKVRTSSGVATSENQATEADVLAAADRNPAFNTNIRTNLRPGQRFFILNGQPLFSDYPNQLYPSANPEINLKYAEPESAAAPAFIPQPAEKNASPYQNLLLRSAPLEDVPAHRLGEASLSQAYPENLVLLNHPGGFQDDFFFRGSLPASLGQTKEFKQQIKEDSNSFGALQETSDRDNDAVVINAREQQDEAGSSETDAEVVSAPEKSAEPTIAQAHPGAIALAGPGGVAAAAPRGNAFVGKEGVAVSSPQATAIAGPTRDEIEQKTKKQNKRKQ